jgi:DNA-binding NarL/FixJ family response regulator
MLSSAHGFVEKSATLDILKDAIQEVADGATCFGDDNTKILNIAIKKSKSSRSSELLTGREREILQLVAEGLSTRLISESLISVLKLLKITAQI